MKNKFRSTEEFARKEIDRIAESHGEVVYTGRFRGKCADYYDKVVVNETDRDITCNSCKNSIIKGCYIYLSYYLDTIPANGFGLKYRYKLLVIRCVDCIKAYHRRNSPVFECPENAPCQVLHLTRSIAS